MQWEGANQKDKKEYIDFIASYFMKKVITHLRHNAKKLTDIPKANWQIIIGDMIDGILAEEFSFVSFWRYGNNFEIISEKQVLRSFMFYSACNNIWDSFVSQIQDEIKQSQNTL